ncbi:MAG: hypothetical protein J6L91_07500 [Clostridia bacterium]|nr:hypothetical protein [Clostridia bacterium]
MKFKLGFSLKDENENEETVTAEAAETEKSDCVRSVVNVRFADGRILPYYNDSFNLQKGDCVYVDGKLAGRIGTVIDVTTRFKVDLEYYKRVVAKLNFDFHGEFVKINTLMVSFDKKALPFEQVKSWYFPPKEKEQEFFTGDGYTFDLLEDEAYLDFKVAKKAAELLDNGGLKYLSIIDGVGRAIIGNENLHIVEFRYNAETCVLTDIFCDCLAFGLCKHCVAVCLALHTLINDEQYDEEKSFCALDNFTFFENAIKNVKKITL